MNNVLTNPVRTQSEPAAARWLLRLLSQLRCGSIELHCPDGRKLSFAGTSVSMSPFRSIPATAMAFSKHGFIIHCSSFPGSL